jgi:hypothetical protein
MKAKHPTTTNAIITTFIWTVGLVMFIFDFRVLFFTPMAVFAIGFISYGCNPEDARRKITLKDLARRLSAVLLFVLFMIIVIHLKNLYLLEPLPKLYRIIGMICVYLLITLLLWREWLKAR